RPRPLRWRPPGQLKRPARRVQPGMAQSPVGLEYRALGPLVPGIDENKVSLVVPSGATNGGRQPVAIAARRSVGQDPAASRTTRLVVPARIHGWIERVLGQVPVARMSGKFAPVQHLAGGIRVDQALLAEIGRAAGRG